MPRALPLLAVVLAAASAGTAVAAPARPKPACLQVMDDTGDAGLSDALPQTSADSLDIVSGDIATGRKNLVAVIRVKSLQAAEALTTGGSIHRFYWVSGGVTRSVAYRTYSDGTPADAVYDVDESTGFLNDLMPIAAVRDPAAGTITFTVPRKHEPGLKKPGTVISGLRVATHFGVNRKNGFSSTGADTAESAKRYTDGAPTCLKGT